MIHFFGYICLKFPEIANIRMFKYIFLSAILWGALTSSAQAVCFSGGVGREDAFGQTASWTAMSVSSSEAQAFMTTDGPVLMSALTITQDIAASGEGVLAAKDLRVIIPGDVAMVWDSDDTAAVITGSGLVSGTVSYENGNKTLVLNVTGDFVDGDTVTVSGLRFRYFSFATGVPGYLNLDIAGDGTVYARDIFSKMITTTERSTGFAGGLGTGSAQTDLSGWRDRSMHSM